jgi:hypothetical protein
VVDAQGRRDDGLESIGKQRVIRAGSRPRGRSPSPPAAVATPARTSVLAAEVVSDLGAPFQELGTDIAYLEAYAIIGYAATLRRLLCVPRNLRRVPLEAWLLHTLGRRGVQAARLTRVSEGGGRADAVDIRQAAE